MRMPCFLENLVQRLRMAGTTTILNSSLISETKVAICFLRRSKEDSTPVLRKVVMVIVVIEWLVSVMKFSRSMLHAVTVAGWVIYKQQQTLDFKKH